MGSVRERVEFQLPAAEDFMTRLIAKRISGNNLIHFAIRRKRDLGISVLSGGTAY
jgi:hypothetical protein